MGIADHERQFRQWLGEHKGLLVKVVRAFADGPTDQDDLLQEILLQVWLSLPNFRHDSKPTTWLYKVALNTALVWKRGERRRRSTESSLSTSEAAAPRVRSAEVEQNDRVVDELYAAIRALPPAKRALVVLYMDGFTYREIADVVGISESNVGVSLNRIKKELAATIHEGSNDP